MRGTVKWFSFARGYGFIVGDDQVEYHFSVRQVHGATLPKNAAKVEFDPTTTRRGPKAQNVRVIAGPASDTGRASRPDDRATCPHCGHKMVPRLQYVRGILKNSRCPFCGGIFKKFGFEIDWDM